MISYDLTFQQCRFINQIYIYPLTDSSKAYYANMPGPTENTFGR
jgi:hypothetical protein